MPAFDSARRGLDAVRMARALACTWRVRADAVEGRTGGWRVCTVCARVLCACGGADRHAVAGGVCARICRRGRMPASVERQAPCPPSTPPGVCSRAHGVRARAHGVCARPHVVCAQMRTAHVEGRSGADWRAHGVCARALCAWGEADWRVACAVRMRRGGSPIMADFRTGLHMDRMDSVCAHLEGRIGMHTVRMDLQAEEDACLC
jgi:hypothetical protein